MLFIFKKWQVFSPWNKAAVIAHFSSMSAVFNLQGEIISKGPQSEIFSQEIEGKTYFIKRYFRSKGLSSWLGFSRLRVEARNQQWFNKIGISAARVVAYGEESFFLKTIRGVLVTEGLDDVTDLAEISRNYPEKFQSTQWRNAVITDLAQVIAKLHQNRFCHNDLHWRNVLIQENEVNNVPKIYLIDCPSGKHLFWPFLYYRKLKDLASLDKLAPNYLSRTQRLRFYLEYRQITKLSTKDKTMIHEIFARKASRLKRKVKKNL
jgi:tRNA A-37 threonylcarbamoyl transferase component Bud32